MTGAHGGGHQFVIEVREVSVAPLPTHDFTKATPEELGRHTREEYMVRVFLGIAKLADTIALCVALEYLHP